MEPWFAALARPTAADPSAAAHNNAWPGAPPEPARCANEQAPSSSTRCPPVISKAPAAAPSHPHNDRSLFERHTASGDAGGATLAGPTYGPKDLTPSAGFDRWRRRRRGRSTSGSHRHWMVSGPLPCRRDERRGHSGFPAFEEEHPMRLNRVGTEGVLEASRLCPGRSHQVMATGDELLTLVWLGPRTFHRR